MPIFAYPNIEALAGFIFLGIGIFFVLRKVNAMKFRLYVLTNGVKTQAQITHTNWEHNDRTVKAYNFQFIADGKTFDYEYRSAYKRLLQTEDQLTIFYIQNNPYQSFLVFTT